MKIRLTILSAAVALGVAAAVPAQAHWGNDWGQTAVTAGYNIQDAGYEYVLRARCYAPDAALQRATASRSWVSRGKRWWNHLACKVWHYEGACWVLFHQTGEAWNAFQLTRYPLRDAPSCSPYDLGRRRY